MTSQSYPVSKEANPVNSLPQPCLPQKNKLYTVAIVSLGEGLLFSKQLITARLC